MKIKRFFITMLALAAGLTAFAQETEYVQNNWFAGIGGGVNISWDGERFVDRPGSHIGAGYAADVYIGKWFNDIAGFRVGWQGLTTSDQYIDFAKKKLMYVHGDILVRAHRNIIPYVHAGYMKIDKGTAAGGLGLMFPIYLGKVVRIVPDFRYAIFPNAAIDRVGPKTGRVGPGSNLSATLGLAFNLGGKLKPKTVYVDRESIKYVDKPYAVHDTVYIRETVPDTDGKAAEINEFLRNTTLFEFDSYEITEEAKFGLDKVVDWLKKYPKVTAKVDGHTDNIGTAAYNQKLSENRAKAIVDYLVKKGIAANRLSYEGHGFNQPAADNKTWFGRHQNRRIEITFTNHE